MSENKRIKSYVLRAGRMSSCQRTAYENLKGVHCIEYSDEPLDLKTVSPEQKEYFLEIGFGMGDATHIIADENRDKGYIGVEVHSPGVGKLLSEIDNKGLDNLKAIEHDAVEVLQNMIPDKSLDGIHIFFPDPWQKKKHNKRRLIQDEFVTLLTSKLKKGGYLYSVSDWEDYADQILEVFSNNKDLENGYDLWAEPQTWRPSTKFENKGLRKNHLIREVFFRKK